MIYGWGVKVMNNPGIERLITLPTCRAFMELKDRSPLTEVEWGRFRGFISECGLKGMPFDDASYVYPLQIPQHPRVRVLHESPRVISALGIYDRSVCIGIVGDAEFERHYSAHAGAFVYVVGKYEKVLKDNREFYNLRPRGWVIVEIDQNPAVVLEKDERILDETKSRRKLKKENEK